MGIPRSREVGIPRSREVGIPRSREVGIPAGCAAGLSSCGSGLGTWLNAERPVGVDPPSLALDPSSLQRLEQARDHLARQLARQLQPFAGCGAPCPPPHLWGGGALCAATPGVTPSPRERLARIRLERSRSAPSLSGRGSPPVLAPALGSGGIHPSQHSRVAAAWDCDTARPPGPG